MNQKLHGLATSPDEKFDVFRIVVSKAEGLMHARIAGFPLLVTHQTQISAELE
jgi:hypothetical protein